MRALFKRRALTNPLKKEQEKEKENVEAFFLGGGPGKIRRNFIGARKRKRKRLRLFFLLKKRRRRAGGGSNPSLRVNE